MQIDVVLVAFPNHPARIAYFRRTLAALRAHLTASRHTLRFAVSSESEQDHDSTWHGGELEAICLSEDIPLHWRTGPASLGAGMNSALRVGIDSGHKANQSPMIFLVQDDYELLYPLDLSSGAEMLEANRDVDMIRYSFPTLPEFATQFTGDRIGDFQEVDIDGRWPYGDDPHLRTTRMTDRNGWYAHGIGHAAEGDMIARLASLRATIYAADKCYFRHFGDIASVPLNQEQRERTVSR
jgi:hypothetical protein